MAVTVERVAQVDQTTLNTVNGLIKQLVTKETPLKLDQEGLGRLVTGPATQLLFARDDNAVLGMGTLVLFQSSKGWTAFIEDVVVNEGDRGKGIGRLLTVECMKLAQAGGAKEISLSTNSDRVAANALYEDLGFTLQPSTEFAFWKAPKHHHEVVATPGLSVDARAVRDHLDGHLAIAIEDTIVIASATVETFQLPTATRALISGLRVTEPNYAYAYAALLAKCADLARTDGAKDINIAGSIAELGTACEAAGFTVLKTNYYTLEGLDRAPLGRPADGPTGQVGPGLS